MQKRYRSPLELTEKGKNAGNMISRKINSIVAAASAGLSECERETMYTALSLISDNLAAISGLKDI